MLIKFIAIVCTLHLALAAPQFVTFKDGKVGVNFGGYHAEAGLGGLLTGNAAHGGLSASAGTPWGPQAAAGLSGGVDGRAAGTAYAGAQLNPSVGASSVIAGSVGEGEGQQGFAGAETYSHGKTKSVVRTQNAVGGGLGGFVAGSEGAHTDGPQVTEPDHNVQTVKTSSVQKIRPHKKYTLVKNEIIQESVRRHQPKNDEIQTNGGDNSNNDNKFTNISSSEGQNRVANTITSSKPPPTANAVLTSSIRTALTTAGPSAEWQEVSKGISVNRQRHRERQRKEQQERHRRTQSPHRRRSHNVQRNKVVVVSSYATQPAHVLEATSSPAANSVTLLANNRAVAGSRNRVWDRQTERSGDGVKNSNARSDVAHSKHLVKSVYREVRLPSGSTMITHDNPPPASTHPVYHQQQPASSGYETETVGVRAHTGGLVGSVLNIPIGILKSLQDSLSGIQLNKSITYMKLA